MSATAFPVSRLQVLLVVEQEDLAELAAAIARGSFELLDEVQPGDELRNHDIVAAREVVLLVSGAAKRAPLTATLRGPVTPDVPASILQLHPNCIVLADEDAAPG